jgi:hypothetical protein
MTRRSRTNSFNSRDDYELHLSVQDYWQFLFLPLPLRSPSHFLHDTSFDHTVTHCNHLHYVFIVITANENKISGGNYFAHRRAL